MLLNQKSLRQLPSNRNPDTTNKLGINSVANVVQSLYKYSCILKMLDPWGF